MAFAGAWKDLEGKEILVSDTVATPRLDGKAVPKGRGTLSVNVAQYVLTKT